MLPKGTIILIKLISLIQITMIDLRSTKTYMINLDKDQKEFPAISEKFSKLGVQVERLSGVYGKELSQEYLDSVMHPYARHTIKTEPVTKWDVVSLGAVGCYLSHIKAWQKLIESEEKLVHVMEDDASPECDIDKMNQFANEVEKIDPEWDVVYFGYFPTPFHSDTRLASGVMGVKSMVYATHSYLISKKGAKKLLEHALPMVNAIDAYMSLSFMHRDIRAYRYKSSLVRQNRPPIPFFSNVQTKVSVKPFLSELPQSITVSCYLVTLVVMVYLIRKWCGCGGGSK